MPQDKEYLLKEQDAAATYQGKLTAGQNIVIDQNNVISALGSTAPPTSVTVTPKTLSGENIADISVNGTTYPLFSSYPRTMTGATTAAAGQSGYVPTPYLGSEDYVLYGSGEWKDPHVPVITANPAGSTTTLLNKLYLDGTIYGIAGGGGSGSTVSITPTFLDGVKIADYEIDGTSGVLKIPVKELTQTEYDALPNTKLTDNVVYYISGAKVLDPNYTYHTWGENDEIIVRVYHEGESDENIIWFFNGWNQTVAYETIPSSLASYAPDYDAGVILSANYPNGGTVQDGWIGFYQSTIRAWDQGKGQNVTGIKYGVVIVTNGAEEQLNPYEDDPYIYTSSSIKKIVVNGTEYGNTGGGTEVIPNPSEEPTDILNSITIDDTVYSITGGGGGTEKVTSMTLPSSDWYKNQEVAMNITWSASNIVCTWDGGMNIGACMHRTVKIPADAKKIRFKITTGTSYSTTIERFKIGIGLRATDDTSWVYPDSAYTSDWLMLKTYATNNSAWEDELDLSGIQTDTYLYICCHGWNMTVTQLDLVEIESKEKIKGLTQAEYDALPSSKNSDGVAYFVDDSGTYKIMFNGHNYSGT